MRVSCHEGRLDGIGNPADSVNNDMPGSWTCTCYAPAWCPLGDRAWPIGLLRHHSIPRMPTHSHVLGFSLACRDLVAKGVRHDGNAALVCLDDKRPRLGKCLACAQARCIVAIVAVHGATWEMESTGGVGQDEGEGLGKWGGRWEKIEGPGSPFKPFNQLLGVFPAASSHALPEHYRRLMTDPNSPLVDFYPSDFELDMNGNRYAWQVCAVLIASWRKKCEEIALCLTCFFMAVSHPLSPYTFSLDDRCKQLTDRERSDIKEQLDPRARATWSGGMNGYISLCAGDPCPPIFRSAVSGMEDIMDNQVICAIYRLPDAHKHSARPPVGVIFPKKMPFASLLLCNEATCTLWPSMRDEDFYMVGTMCLTSLGWERCVCGTSGQGMVVGNTYNWSHCAWSCFFRAMTAWNLCFTSVLLARMLDESRRQNIVRAFNLIQSIPAPIPAPSSAVQPWCRPTIAQSNVVIAQSNTSNGQKWSTHTVQLHLGQQRLQVGSKGLQETAPEAVRAARGHQGLKNPDNIPATAEPPPAAEAEEADQEQSRSDTKLKNRKGRKYIVTIGDLKAEPPLWHEDSRRKPWENRRQDHPGTISGRQLGEAAHRLVVNSLQAARTGYPVETAQRHHRSSHLTTEGNQHGHSYGQPYASPTVQNSSHRSRHQHESDPYNRSYPRHERNNQSTSQNSEHPGHAYYPLGFQQNGGNRNPSHGPPPHVVQTPTPISAGANLHQHGRYNSQGNYRSYGASSYHHSSGSFAPLVNPSVGRGYGRQQQLGNKFSALSGGASRYPPPPGYHQ
ncbi:5'-3' exoribonuclease 3 [Actinidia rufa]|uniref:5'-3' exoribonuclease 3 n=1 Tax=Actinidia rufa TaxID=165716 RepID=A0A7J0FAG9_9ERIC|nr:5'-3' exoribonuclease 3 [Actinidia rufa]